MQRPFDYWASGEGMGNITPPGNPYPEGDLFMREFTDLLFAQDVVEFGCGPGRLAPFFSKRRYLGVDICPQAIALAQHDRPGYDFMLIDGKTKLEGWGHALFAHNVLMHVPDEELLDTIGLFSQKRIFVNEVLGHNWRRNENPPAFNREINDYDQAFRFHGYALKRVVFKKLERWKASDFAVMEFHKENTNARQS